MKILVIEDDKVDQMAFKHFVKREKLPYDYQLAASVKEAKKCLKEQKFDIVLLDYLLGDGDAFDLLKFTRSSPTIIITAIGSESVAVKAMKEGAFDYLVKDLERNYLKVLPLTVEKALKQKYSEENCKMLSSAIKSIQESIFITNMEGKILFANQAFIKTYQLEPKNVLGRDCKTLWKEKKATGDGEFFHVKRDGSFFQVALSRSVIKDESGHDQSFVFVTRDLTESMLIKKRQTKMAEKLENVNQDLNNFAHIVSHDLKAPLRGIISLIHWITEDIQKYLDQRGKEQVDLLVQRAKRMHDRNFRYPRDQIHRIAIF